MSETTITYRADMVQFGSYAGKPIEWCVLHRAQDRTLLLSRYILDAKLFYSDCIYTSWERSTIRTWLNGEFYAAAFTPQEQARIRPTQLYTPELAGFGSFGCHETTDRIFLLSEDELEQYLPDPAARIAPAAPHAIAYSRDLSDFTKLLPFYGENKSCWWWLRSPGNEPNNMGVVWSDGTVFSGGHFVNYERGIRPALYVSMTC